MKTMYQSGDRVTGTIRGSRVSGVVTTTDSWKRHHGVKDIDLADSPRLGVVLDGDPSGQLLWLNSFERLDRIVPIWPANVVQREPVAASTEEPERPDLADGWVPLAAEGLPAYLRGLVADHTGTDRERWTVRVWRDDQLARPPRVVVGLDGQVWAAAGPRGEREATDLGIELAVVLAALSCLSLRVMLAEVARTT